MSTIPDGETDPIVATSGEDVASNGIAGALAERPLIALAVAAAIGFIVGRIVL